MKFNREELTMKLELCSLALANHEIIPVLSHFCFDKRFCTAYDGFIAIRTSLSSGMAIALEGMTLLKLVKSLTVNEVQINHTEDVVTLFAHYKTNKGTKAKLAFLEKSSFSFKMPRLKACKRIELSQELAKDLKRGLELCLNSVGSGEYHASQKGITLQTSGEKLYLYSTNIESLSRYIVRNWPKTILFKNNILLTRYCKALLKGFEEYGTEGVVLYGGADFLIVEFSMGKDVCYMYCSYYENRDPLNFRNACDDHLHSGWMKEMVPVNKKVVQAFQRTLLMLPDKLLPLVQVYIDQKMGYKITTVNQQRGQLVDYIQTTKKEKLPTKYGDITFYMDVSSALNALEHCDKLLFTQDCSIFSCQNYVQLVINRSEPIVAQDNLG